MSTNQRTPPVTPTFKPLLTKEEHLPVILNGIAWSKIVDQHILQAEQAGLDMTQQKKDNAERLQKLLALKNAYFPGT